MATQRKRIFGWMMYDWATQPFHTLIITFFFAPYFAEVLAQCYELEGADPKTAKANAQVFWARTLAFSGIAIAIAGPIFGAIADVRQRRMPLIVLFSGLFVFGSAGLWFATPHDFDAFVVALWFAIGLVGLELTTVFTNAILPSLGEKEKLGRISGNGWALGYVGGLIALVFALLFLADDSSGKTFLGGSPIFGLDGDAREGSRAIGPFVAIWFIIFMIPFFLWNRDERRPVKTGATVKGALTQLMGTLRRLPQTPSLFAYLASSMFYRDALNGVFAFGGIYAFGVLGWGSAELGVFGIVAIITGAIFSYLGGKADAAFGPKQVVQACIIVLMLCVCAMLTTTRETVFFVAIDTNSNLPDLILYVCGGIIGAAAGAIQAASRTLMVHQADPERMNEAFGLYALSGKATAFLAPMLIAITTEVTNSQALGIAPLAGLFLVALVLLRHVKSPRPKA